VRVHEDGGAESIGAVAYTWGHDVHFAPGRYRPETASGQALLGHELTHVVQRNPSTSGVKSGLRRGRRHGWARRRQGGALAGDSRRRSARPTGVTCARSRPGVRAGGDNGKRRGGRLVLQAIAAVMPRGDGHARTAGDRRARLYLRGRRREAGAGADRRQAGVGGAGSVGGGRAARAGSRSSGCSSPIRSGRSSRRRALGKPFTRSLVTACR
jgi:hypothetical protein